MREKANVTAAITISASDSNSVGHHHAAKLVAEEGRKVKANFLCTISQVKCFPYHLENTGKTTVSDISDICPGLAMRATISTSQFNTKFMAKTENTQPAIFILADKASNKK